MGILVVVDDTGEVGVAERRDRNVVIGMVVSALVLLAVFVASTEDSVADGALLFGVTLGIAAGVVGLGYLWQRRKARPPETPLWASKTCGWMGSFDAQTALPGAIEFYNEHHEKAGGLRVYFALTPTALTVMSTRGRRTNLEWPLEHLSEARITLNGPLRGLTLSSRDGRWALLQTSVDPALIDAFRNIGATVTSAR